MLTDIRKNLIIFDSMIETIQAVSPKQPLHPELRPFLDRVMKEHASALDYELLEEIGLKPKNAYYVVSGFVLLIAYDEQGDPYVYRIYRANSMWPWTVSWIRRRLIAASIWVRIPWHGASALRILKRSMGWRMA